MNDAVRCRPLCCTREKNDYYYDANIPSQFRSLIKAATGLCLFNGDKEKPVYVGQENTFPEHDSCGIVYSS